ncbi:right-handed parallel beta-helix repeat-containing protein [Paenibacillus sp. S150]|uniref:right-handed parallel beta-helix repeat-containing protein n=1 Tax=Paenibacillus sp. S150 TaxID=2749826 RepID=UPI001C56D818|nr:right-handed parallel beta-helix repeat-containing protein [Paenibacillus sp. S150]MBW4082436.1 right-handed parallel beta-helix repeat-containing protein [Paenibacillus sp. S150]
MEATNRNNEFELQLYVHPGSGDDSAGGSRNLPFRTIEAAQKAVREAVRSGQYRRITVFLRGGTYELAAPLRFGSRDAAGDCRVTYRNAEGEVPVLLGGTVLSGWTVWRDGIWRAALPQGTRFQTLYADGERVYKARLPASGYFEAGALAGKEREGILFREGEVPEQLDPAAMQLFVWPGEGEWNWCSETIPVRRIDPAARTIELERPCTWGIGEGSRYFLQGALEFLREPGQYHLDEAADRLYYRPRNGNPLLQTVIAPKLLRLLEIYGEDEAERVSGLAFQGLTLACTDFYADYRMMRSEPGMDNAEPDEHRNGVVYIRNAADVEISACTIRGSGACGIFLDRCAERITLAGNRIEGIGHTAVYAAGYAPGEGGFAGPAAADQNRNHLITNNRISHGGELVGHGSGILLYQCGDCVVSHNLISQMPRYGISLKGQRHQLMPDSLWGVPVTWENHWDFLFTRSNSIRYNDISEVMTGSQDGGLVESWGIGRRNVIHGNRLHHSGIHFSFGFGIYLDDASDDVEVTHNVLDHLYSTGEGKLWMTIFSKGIGNVIRNNLMVDNPQAVNAIGSQEMVGEANRDITVEGNIIADSGHLYCFVNWSPERFRAADRNLFWRSGASCRISGELPAEPAGRNEVWGNEYDWAAWRSVLDGKYDAGTLLAAPGFVDGAAGDYRLRPSSPVYGLGWEDIDFSLIGPRENWREEAGSARGTGVGTETGGAAGLSAGEKGNADEA